MRRLYSITKKQFVGAAILCFTLSNSFTGFGQTCIPITVASNCQTGITENFQNTGGSTAEFTGDFSLEAASNGVNADKFLESSPVSAGTTKTLLSPTFIAPGPNGTINLRFDLSGTNATIDNLQIIARTNAGDVVFCPIINSNIGVNCFTFVTSPILANKAFRFAFIFTVSGNGGRNVDFDDFGTNLSFANSPLPVTFTSLDARKVEGGTQLTWKVAGEQNVKGYDVEKSTNGNQFSKIGTIAATGKDVYSFVDGTANVGKVFYRIRNNDTDGKFKYSVVLSFIQGKAGMELKAFPLPAKNSLTLQHAATTNGKISITTEDGRLVKTAVPANGSIQTNLDISSLKAGLYIVRFNNGNGQTESLKVIKQ